MLVASQHPKVRYNLQNIETTGYQIWVNTITLINPDSPVVLFRIRTGIDYWWNAEMTIIYQDLWIRKLFHSSHKRSKYSNTILCKFSRWDQRIREDIPIPDSLGKEATFINICISNGGLKCLWVMISTTPSFGNKVICWYTGFTFETFI